MIKTGYWNKLLIAFSFVFVLSSCDLFELDINDDPNNPTTASINLLLTQAELSLANTMISTASNAVNLHDNLHGFCGILASEDNFQLAQSNYDEYWNAMYAGPLKDIEGIIQTASDPVSPHYLGIGQLLKAYAFTTMVDLFGDIPYSEALKGDAAEAIKAPKFDDEEAIYDDALALIEQAIINLDGNSPVAVTGDIIYAGSSARWLKFARSLKLKLLIQTRHVNPTALQDIEKMFTDGGLISTAAEDFQFQFSKLQSSNDVRHQWYDDSYTLGVNNFGYILHQYMVEMLEDKDPRFPFYFRRQTKTVLDQNDPSQRNTTPCSMTPGCIYGYVVLNANLHQRIYATTDLSQAQIDFLAGIFGRDRSDPAGVPQDADFRTMPGVYPAAGRYDVTAPGLPGSFTAPGGGIFPMLTHVNVDFYKIEAILTLGIAGDARAAFETAMRNHIAKVVNFGVATDANSVRPDQAAIDAYVALWLSRYDAQASNDSKLNVVMKQFWFSSWGNGYEIYNAMRRTTDPNASNAYGYTGFPNTIQEPILAPRKFPLRLPYPQQELSINPNAASYSSIIYDQVRLFWDPN